MIALLLHLYIAKAKRPKTVEARILALKLMLSIVKMPAFWHSAAALLGVCIAQNPCQQDCAK